MKKYLLTFFMLLVFLLSGCNRFTSERKTGLPNYGMWFCEELKIGVCFPKTSRSYVIVDGNTVPCSIDGDYGCDWFYVVGLGGSYPGHIFFRGECDYWDEDKMLVTELLDSEGTVKGKFYLFVRMDKEDSSKTEVDSLP